MGSREPIPPVSVLQAQNPRISWILQALWKEDRLAAAHEEEKEGGRDPRSKGRQETMILQLEIPKEFEKDYRSNRFEDFFRRVYADIDSGGLCGNYEGETAQMMERAFKESRCLDDGKTC